MKMMVVLMACVHSRGGCKANKKTRYASLKLVCSFHPIKIIYTTTKKNTYHNHNVSKEKRENMMENVQRFRSQTVKYTLS